MDVNALYLVVHGHVQGVGYRHFVSRAARKLGVNGFVRNEPDGSVSVFVKGDSDQIENFISEINVDFANGPSVLQIERHDPDSDKFPDDIRGIEFSKFEVLV